jgi:hypothetical protein
MKTHLVEVLISVAEDRSGLTFTGDYVLRAFAADGALLHEATATVSALRVSTSDYARLLTLTHALNRLHGKLCGGRAWYALRVVQSSKNVDGWLARDWKRKAAQVKTLAGRVDILLAPFLRREFVKLPREALDARMKVGEGVMLPA